MSFIIVHHDKKSAFKGIEMPRPSDFHAHFRQGPLLEAVLPHQACWVRYALAMPNTGPIKTVSELRHYRLILQDAAQRSGLTHVEFVMTIYYTGLLTPKIIEEIARLPFKVGVKAYPPHKGATTGSGEGVPILDLPDVLAAMRANDVPLLIHGESVYDKNGNELPHEEREGEFMRELFPRVREQEPDLRICLEHVSTQDGIDAVKSDGRGKTVCTLTPHHAICSSEDFTRSWANHLRCMPIPKAPEHRDAVREFMTSGDKRAILGTDTAPHIRGAKVGMPFSEAACGCYLPHAIAMYALIFKEAHALDARFANFASFNGPDWWGLPRPAADDRISIRVEHEHDIPEPTPVPELREVVIPLGWSEAPDRMRIGLAQALLEEHAH